MVRFPLRVTVIAALFVALLPGCGAQTLDEGDIAAESLCAGHSICAEVFIEACCGPICFDATNVPCDHPFVNAPMAEEITRARCVLEAGRDGLVGRYQVSVNLNTGGDGAPKTTTIVNFGDGFASTQVTSMPSTGAVESPAERHAFKPKAFFDDCLASPTDGQKLLWCVLDMNETASVVGLSCPP